MSVAPEESQSDPESGDEAAPPAKDVRAGSLSPRRNRSTKGSRKLRVPGTREVKEYPLDEAELNELGALSVISTILFSAAGVAFGFAFDISKDIAFSQNTPPGALGFWEAVRMAAMAATVLFTVGGIGVVVWRGTRLRDIKHSTSHD